MERFHIFLMLSKHIWKLVTLKVKILHVQCLVLFQPTAVMISRLVSKGDKLLQ